MSSSRVAERHGADRSGVGFRFVSVCISVHHLYPRLTAYAVDEGWHKKTALPWRRCARVGFLKVGCAVRLGCQLGLNAHVQLSDHLMTSHQARRSMVSLAIRYRTDTG
jgi:hypothetical protein